MSKFAKNTIKNVVIAWGVVSVECQVRTKHEFKTTIPITENLNANLPAFKKKSKQLVG